MCNVYTVIYVFAPKVKIHNVIIALFDDWQIRWRPYLIYAK